MGGALAAPAPPAASGEGEWDRGLLYPGDVALGGGLQTDGGGDGLLVVEHQRWQRGPGRELVAPTHPAIAVDRVAELAQSLDVAAQCAGADLEPVREFGAQPVPRRRPGGGLPGGSPAAGVWCPPHEGWNPLSVGAGGRGER